jgi:hypothetical protein
MEYFTYNEWKSKGYYVIKGQKSHKRNETGVAVFSLEQVEPELEENLDWLIDCPYEAYARGLADE